MVNYKSRFVIFFLLGLVALQAFSQVNVLRFEQINTKDGLPQNSVQSIAQDKYGFLWFSSFASLCKYDGYKFTQYRAEPNNPKSLVSRGIYNIAVDSNENVWIAFFDTTYLCRYNYETDDFTRFIRHNVDADIRYRLDRAIKPNNLSNEYKGFTWSYINGMLHKTNVNSGETSSFCIILPQNQKIPDDMIAFMYIDKFETLWLGSENQGVFKVNTNIKPFFSYYQPGKDCKNLIDDYVRAINEDDKGNLWIGTYFNGIIIFNRQKGEYFFIEKLANNPNSLINSEIRRIYMDKNGFVWIGTKGGLDKYDPKNKKFYHYITDLTYPVERYWIYAIIEDYKGTLWIGTFGGIARYNPKIDDFIWYDSDSLFLNRRVTEIIEDKNHNLWVSTQGGGITCLKRKKNGNEFVPVHYINDPENPNSISSNRIFSMLIDDEGFLWAATEYGFNRLNMETGEFLRFTQNEGLINEITMGLLYDNNDQLWISHKSGLTRFNTKSFVMHNFTEQDGLQSNEFSENACYRSPVTGEMFFGGIVGLNSFYPDSIKDNYLLPEIRFTDLHVLNQQVKCNDTINGRVILKKPIWLTDEIELRYSDKSFSIEFAALHYANPKANKYSYMLEGFDKNWIDANASMRMATYSNLSPKSYTFKVKASNNDEIWNPQIATLKIVVLPPWWNTIWAYLAYFLIIATILYLIYAYIVSREKLKNQLRYEHMKAKKLAELDQQKMQFFTNVSHEFRTPLTLLIDPLRKLKTGEVKPKQVKFYYTLMYQNATYLLGLINQLLNFRKIESGKLPLETRQSNVVEFIGHIVETFSLTAEQRNIQLIYKASPEHIITYFDHDKIEKILINLLSNAFKYTANNGKISIEIKQFKENTDKKYDEYYEIKVTDNGIGISHNTLNKIFDIFYQAKLPGKIQTQGTGIGLAYTKQLVELHKGIISVQSQEGRGSVFTVIIPVLNEPEMPNETEIPSIEEKEIEELNDLKEVDITDMNEEVENEIQKGNTKERLSVLIVEDNKDVRAYLKNELMPIYEVIETVNGKQGLEAAIEHVPDIIISDIMMPEMDGFELCKKVKTDKRISHIPVILLTARQSDKFKIEGYEIGADAYVTKPFNMKMLFTIIKNLIETRKKLREASWNAPFIDIKKIAANTTDEQFLNTVVTTIEESISEEEFNIDLLAKNLELSRRQLTHKIKTLTSQTVLEFVKTVRLNKGAELLLTTDFTVSEIAFKLGYNEPGNFSRSFSKQFGKSPSDFVESISEKN